MTLSARLYRFLASCERRHGPTFRVLRACLLVGGLGIGLGGGLAACSIAVPMGGVFGADGKITTQSINPASTPGAFSELTPDDWSFASIALATALDPVGSGESAPWANPRTGITGEFTAVSKPYLRNDLVCRDFKGSLDYQGARDKLNGSACRQPDGRWTAASAPPG
ncbi:RT0821/Lpp0805 family surface protein [Pseudochelatococcus contaminans]|uniref:Surface antigen n=1 Tax=Pseudochelatococcus contaminans TaxID=1538103 RepID=A0A7W5Z281_9HYPH|nr:surface antigen [Pseudochelatococcus contaminans]